MTAETRLKENIKKAVKMKYPNAFMWKVSDRYTNGIPDLLIINNGVHTFIELKAGKNNTSRIQRFQIRRIKGAGGSAYVCRTVSEVMNVLKNREESRL